MSAPALALLALLATPPWPAPAPDLPERIDAALRAGAAWLLPRQQPDGSWRSEDYGAFKDGYSQTPFVASALMFAPPDMAGVEAAHRRAADFVAGLVDDQGALRVRLNYPIYSLAGALIVLSVPTHDRHRAARDALVKHLSARQLTAQHGWTPSDVSHGGWGYFTGPLTRPAPGQQTSHLLSANLSSTVYALGALQLAGVPRDDPRIAAARGFVERCQNWAPPAEADPRFDDGGFFFTPANRLQNKADLAPGSTPEAPRYVSYGSMTADGLRALQRVGHRGDGPRVKAALDWIDARFDPERPGGDYPPGREVQRRSVYYYWAWTTAHALMYRADRRRLGALAEAILKRQGEDGAWRNPSTDLREDDPLIATPFAMAALAIARYVHTGAWRTAFDAGRPGAGRATPAR